MLGALDASADKAQRAVAERRTWLGEWAQQLPGLGAVQRLWSSATAAAARQAGTLVRCTFLQHHRHTPCMRSLRF